MKSPRCSVTIVCLLLHVVTAVDDVPNSRENVHDEASRDMEASATGYIFRNGNGLGHYGKFGGLRSGLSSGGFGTYGGAAFGPQAIGTGNIGGGLGLGEYNGIGGVDDFELGLAGEGLGYNVAGGGVGGVGGGGNLILGALPQGNIGYGVSKNGIGLAGLGQGISGLGGGIARTGILGYGGISGAGPHRGQYIPGTVALGGVGQAGGGGIASNVAFAKGGESDYKAGHEAVQAGQAGKGYKVAEGFDKGEKGHVDKDHRTGGYSAAGGAKKGEEEEAKKYAANEATAKGEKGESYGKSEGHKKGHKTSGFHNVYHKDEYKKDTSFYDDNHLGGHEEAYGSENAHHSLAKGAHEKVAKADAAYHEDEHVKKGAFTNGHQYGTVQGHDREEAEKEHYGNEVEYANQANHKAGQTEGLSTGTFTKKLY